jgi:hypothetical protein
MNQATTGQSGAAEIARQPGALLHLVAAGLIRSGAGVGLVPPPLVDEPCLPIACPHARCTLTVHDGGQVILEWRPAAGQVDPKQLADMACALLTGQAGEQPRLGDGYGRRTVTLKGVVGREMAARGLMVDLELYPDPVFYGVSAAIVITSPDSDLETEVWVADDGCLSWECDYGAASADLGELTADIVARVTAALSVAGPGPARGRRAWPWLRWLAPGVNSSSPAARIETDVPRSPGRGHA